MCVLLFRHWRHEYAASATGTDIDIRKDVAMAILPSARHDAQQTDNGDLVRKLIIK